jgi:hypothetical protein
MCVQRWERIRLTGSSYFYLMFFACFFACFFARIFLGILLGALLGVLLGYNFFQHTPSGEFHSMRASINCALFDTLCLVQWQNLNYFQWISIIILHWSLLKFEIFSTDYAGQQWPGNFNFPMWITRALAAIGREILRRDSSMTQMWPNVAIKAGQLSLPNVNGQIDVGGALIECRSSSFYTVCWKGLLRMRENWKTSKRQENLIQLPSASQILYTYTHGGDVKNCSDKRMSSMSRRQWRKCDQFLLSKLMVFKPR